MTDSTARHSPANLSQGASKVLRARPFRVSKALAPCASEEWPLRAFLCRALAGPSLNEPVRADYDVGEAVMSPKPIFFDPSGRRGRILSALVWVSGTISLLTIVAFVLTLAVVDWPPQQGQPSASTAASTQSAGRSTIAQIGA